MEPRWQKDWQHVDFDRCRACVGGFGRFDLWTVENMNHDNSYHVRVVWGANNDWDHYYVSQHRLSDGQFNEVGGPTPEELLLIEQYLSLFVPHLGLVRSEGEDDGT